MPPIKGDVTYGVTPAGAAAVKDAPGNDAQAIIEAVERLSGAAPLEIGGVTVAVLPKGQQIVSVKSLIDEYAKQPDRITGTATIADEASFAAHVNVMKLDATAIFCEASFKNPSMTAVYDYHDVDVIGVGQRPAFGVHRAVWPMRLSKEWTAWAEQAGQWMSHAEFAEFLERHVPDVYWGDDYSEYTKLLVSTLELKLATPAQLVALSRNLVVNVDTAIRSAQTLSSGEIAMTYTETHKDGEGQPIRVPNAFLIAIPVIHRGPAFQMLVRLRYRVGTGKVAWAFELHRADIVFDTAIDEVCVRIAAETERPVYRGAPEK